MDIADKIRSFMDGPKFRGVIAVVGAAGLLLILLSSLLPSKADDTVSPDDEEVLSEAQSYCSETEKRLEAFLGSIEGAGEVRVCISVGSNERYIYASEGKRSEADNRTEVEEKYVMTGSGGEKKPIIETVRTPEISGAVIAAEGYDSPTVRERLYKAASAALDIPTGKIYVTKLG